MFRGPQILALTCPIRNPRPLLLGVRDPRVSAAPETPSPKWEGPRARSGSSTNQGGGCIRGGGRGGGEETLLSAVSLRGSGCGESPLKTSPQNSSTPKAASSSSPHQPQEDSSLNPVNHPPGWPGAWLAFNPWETTMLEHFEQNCEAVHNPDSSNDIKCLQQHRRPTYGSQHPSNSRPILSSIKPKPQSPFQGRPFHSRPSLRPLLGSSIPQPWTLDLRRAPLSRGLALSLPQARGLQQAAVHREAALRECLSLENKERCRRNLGPNLGLYDGDRARRGAQGQGRWASVLVSLCSVEGEPAFLFTLRSSTLKGRHKGDVSFAGGKRDPMDRGVVDTALREAREELGVTVATESVWGVLKPLRDMTGMMIAPVLANLGPLERLSFKPNPGEVEEIFTLSLSHVCSPENTGYTHFRTGERYGYTLPVFRNGKHRVWGLTAVALDHTLKVILPS